MIGERGRVDKIEREDGKREERQTLRQKWSGNCKQAHGISFGKYEL